jgi:hypothetical protein
VARRAAPNGQTPAVCVDVAEPPGRLLTWLHRRGDRLPAGELYIRWTDGRQYAAVVVPVRNGSGGATGTSACASRVLASTYFIAQWGSTLSVSVRRMMFNASFEDAVQRFCAWPARGLADLFLAHQESSEGSGFTSAFALRAPADRFALGATADRQSRTIGIWRTIRLKPDATGVYIENEFRPDCRQRVLRRGLRARTHRCRPGLPHHREAGTHRW